MTHRPRAAALLLAALLLSPTLLVAESHEAAAPPTDEEKVFYVLGLLLSRNVATFDLSAEEVAVVQAGLADGVLGRDTHGVDPMAYQAQLQQLAQDRTQRKAEAEKAAAVEFLARAAAEEGAETTETGLVYTELRAGEGASPTATDRVTVHYHGTLRDGSVFDSSVDRGQPVTFPLSQVVPCWTEGVAKMKVGGKSRLVCPSDIAYGDAGRPPVIGPGATLIFEVELLGIESPDESPE
ncbi:MAG: FKBP-type peptidyl-prolyl cis-trans isomerase [Thermoanaerobaculia bacterium]|nr:FKBP-type peptidyl-prolyl cis-trans isomerase [Thermoanaerobaculia bacterium]